MTQAPEPPAAVELLRAAQAAAYIADDFGGYFALSRQLAEASPGFARSYEAWQHAVLHALARKASPVRFLQVGGMDGKRYDPIYAFVRHYRWQGAILEPLPDLFRALSANYAGQPGVTLVNAALTPTDGERCMARVRPQAVSDGTVPLWAEGLGTFFPERNALGGVGLKPEEHAALAASVEWQAVRGLTLRSLAAECDLGAMHLLQVDAEGCELDILRQMDAAGYLPRVVHLEYWALPVEERGDLLGLLGARGYALRMSQSDVMAIDATLLAAIDADGGFAC